MISSWCANLCQNIAEIADGNCLNAYFSFNLCGLLYCLVYAMYIKVTGN